jgi:ribonuclease P protein subunit POP4
MEMKEAKYCITGKNARCHELIGLEVRVIESSCGGRVGVGGMVVDETKKTFTIETPKGEKTVPKEECVFEFNLGGGEKAVIEGKKILKRPEDRAKEWGG